LRKRGKRIGRERRSRDSNLRRRERRTRRGRRAGSEMRDRGRSTRRRLNSKGKRARRR
jgi:hypothetical protein